MKYLSSSIAMITIFVAILATAGDDMNQLRTVSGIAATTERPHGAPRYSDVCFSSRWRRPLNDKDPHNTFRDAATFHTTRLDWVYSFDPTWILECKEKGYPFSAALNSTLPDAPGKQTNDKGRVLDKNGQRVTAPWMREWNVWWGCVNSPEYRRSYLAHAKIVIDGGADSIHMDAPCLNSAAVTWGGCYCEHCREKAERQGKELPRDMVAFQESSVKEFYAYIRKEIDCYAGRHVPLSSNNYDGRSGFPYDMFDYGIAELPESSGRPGLLYSKFREAARQGRAQIFTYVSANAPLTRRVIATAYACGGHILAPYDVYHGKRPRIFGNPEQFADLFGFVRANAHYLDGYEDAAIAGKGLKETRYGKAKPMEIDGDNIYAFARARPGEPDAPVVIHLVDWMDGPQACALKVRNSNFFPGKQLAAMLLVPSAYDLETHAKAQKAEDFSLLSKEQAVRLVPDSDGEHTRISVPALDTWGILVLTPE